MSWPWDEVFLARHGQTEWNVQRRRQGQLDSPLTPLGTSQAGRCAVLLEPRGVDAVLTSPQPRCLRTATILGDHLGVPVTVIEELAEVHHGAFAGLTDEEIEHRHAGEWGRRGSDRYRWTFPGGESYADADGRAVQALERLRRLGAARPLIVTHEMIGRMIQRHLLDLDVEQALATRHPHGLVYSLRPGLGRRDVVNGETP